MFWRAWVEPLSSTQARHVDGTRAIKVNCGMNIEMGGRVGLVAIVALIGLLFWGVSLAATLSPEMVLWGGIWLVAGGFGLGLPTGAIYHLMLFRSLGRADVLPGNWWLKPTSLHHLIPMEDRFSVLSWCFAGALGFLVIMFGIVLASVGAYRLLY